MRHIDSLIPQDSSNSNRVKASAGRCKTRVEAADSICHYETIVSEINVRIEQNLGYGCDNSFISFAITTEKRFNLQTLRGRRSTVGLVTRTD